MTSITQWDPFREMIGLRSELDRYFNEPFFNAPRLWDRDQKGTTLALDVIEDEDAFVVKASVPGVASEEIDVTLTENVLTIKGETTADREIDEQRYHVRERRWGSFYRSVTLPVTVEADKIEAHSENGVLTLRLPKAEAVKPKKIAVKKMVTAS